MSAFYNADHPPFNMRSSARAIAAANNGLLFDIGDMSTLFQDAAGTVPVTAVEQPVGLILDKSGNGNHATQPITASRPTLSARYNLLTKTDTFSGWTPSPGRATIVNGLLTAVSTASDVYLRYTTTQLINTKYSMSIEAKQGTTKWLRLRNLAVNNNVNGEAWFDLSSGVLGTVLGSVSASIVDVGGGYFRCSITGSTISTIVANCIDCAPSDADNTRSATVGKNLYVRNPIHNIGELFLPYQRVNTATDYDTNPAYFPKYLKFDGIDDYLNLPYMGLYANGSATVVMSMARSKTGKIKYALAEVNSAGGKNYIPLRLSDSGISSRIINDTGTTVILTPESAGAPNSILEVITFIDDGVNLKLLKNSKIVNNSNYVRAGTLTTNNLTIGAALQAAVTENMSANMYGLIITKSALTDAQRVRCERFLAQKSGVML